MPPSAGACQTTSAWDRPDWGRAARRSSIITAIGWRRAMAGATSWPVSGAGTRVGVGTGVGLGEGDGLGDGAALGVADGSRVGVGVAPAVACATWDGFGEPPGMPRTVAVRMATRATAAITPMMPTCAARLDLMIPHARWR